MIFMVIASVTYRNLVHSQYKNTTYISKIIKLLLKLQLDRDLTIGPGETKGFFVFPPPRDFVESDQEIAGVFLA